MLTRLMSTATPASTSPRSMDTSRSWRSSWQEEPSWTPWCLTATTSPCISPSIRATQIAKKLINAGCKINELIYMGACCGPIHLSIMKENKEIFNLLLEKKCDLDLCDEVNGNTPLMLATSLNQLETVKRLIKEGADI